MGSIFTLIARNWQIYSPTELPKSSNALKLGILGAAKIAVSVVIRPAKTHPEVIIQTIAARDKQRATDYARKHGIPQVHDSYEAILDDPNIDAVYIPLPVSMHREWTLKALAKGKHVMMEKPSVANATEAEALFCSPLLQKPNAPVVLEALHYRFQPTWRYFLSLIDHPNVEHAVASAKLPAYVIPKDSSQLRYEMGGGNLLNLGTYPMCVLRDIMGAEPEECTRCTVRRLPPPNELCDEAGEATFRFPGGRTGEAISDMRASSFSFPTFDVAVTHKEVPVEDGELPAGQSKGRVRKLALSNFMMSAAWHRIDVEDEFIVRRSDSGRVVRRWTKKELKKIYTFRDAGVDQPGKPSWDSFRHQLEQFVNRIRVRDGSGQWVSKEDSLAQAKMIDMAYEKSGLPIRRTSAFVP
ncbi:Gfo/Idh/MocA family protein [Aspergillus lucknowensis]|uniref:D-xylose 1-dehydrogenase (NADP(+), D-xylono-1,5-lactone-forming) n=1 Tax=Aspergillus lucknowensis TaxID=176173 RepID=A0ABR4LY15_9EURO